MSTAGTSHANISGVQTDGQDGTHERWYDAVVVGGGAGGLSGALALVRSRRSVLVIDSGQPRNAPAAHMHNYLTRDGTPPSELLAIGRDEVTGYGGEIMAGFVTSIEHANQAEDRPGFKVGLTDGSSVYGRRVLVATGLIDELPDLPGIRERWGRDVIHCPFCHGWEVQDQAIGILSTGPMAVHSAQMFRQLSADVVLFQHTGPQISEEQREELAARNIAVVEGEVEALEIQDDGSAFDPLQADQPQPADSLEDTPIGGWGIPIVRRLSDELRYHRSAGRNHLTLIFNYTHLPT